MSGPAILCFCFPAKCLIHVPYHFINPVFWHCLLWHVLCIIVISFEHVLCFMPNKLLIILCSFCVNYVHISLKYSNTILIPFVMFCLSLVFSEKSALITCTVEILWPGDGKYDNTGQWILSRWVIHIRILSGLIPKQ